MTLIWKTVDAFKEKAPLLSPDRTSGYDLKKEKGKRKKAKRAITQWPSMNGKVSYASFLAQDDFLILKKDFISCLCCLCVFVCSVHLHMCAFTMCVCPSVQISQNM